MAEEEIYKYYDKAINNLHDIYFYIPLIPKEEYGKMEKIGETIENYRNNIKNIIPVTLLSLKLYTEGKISWERAGELSDLHIFGLKKYCAEKGVDWSILRIDEYYGVKGEEGLQQIISAWEKLDPQGKMQPINYSGDSYYTKYPFMMDKTDDECFINQVNEDYYTNKSRLLFTEILKEFGETINTLKNEGSELNITNNELKSLRLIGKGLLISKEEEYNRLVEVIAEARRILYSSTSPLKDCASFLKNSFNDQYYYYSIKK